jgi:esterase/lipase
VSAGTNDKLTTLKSIQAYFDKIKSDKKKIAVYEGEHYIAMDGWVFDSLISE